MGTMQSAEVCLAARLAQHPDALEQIIMKHPERASAAEQLLKGDLRWLLGLMPGSRKDGQGIQGADDSQAGCGGRLPHALHEAC